MEKIYLTYAGKVYSLNISESTIRDEASRQIKRILDIRSLGLIAAVRLAIEEARRKRYYSLITQQLLSGVVVGISEKN